MDENNEKTLKRILLKDREIILLGTAHVSKESIKDVESTIREENPDCVCVELDEVRYKSLTSKDTWQQINISEVSREGKGSSLFSKKTWKRPWRKTRR